MSELLEQLEGALGARYHVERELGEGGMAVVFLAGDVKHDRKVAVKVLRPEVGDSIGPERFLREIRLAANLTHPHILPVFDSGEADGFLYYVMPYVKGESLRDRLDRQAQLPLAEALKITTQVADALAYAHEHNVIHRDIKPANILLEAGHALLCDFGISRSLDGAGGERLTRTGVSVGTPSYMSPEQVSGETLDARSDVYSLGCVLYEMLAGEPPFTGATMRAVAARHLMDEAPPLKTVRPDLPDRIASAAARALAKVPADRFDTPAELAEEIAGTRSGGSWPSVPAQQIVPVEKSIAVLPFRNVSADPENEYFSDGITEEISVALAGVPALRVAARTSSLVYKDRRQRVQTIGEQLNVATVLEGSVRSAGNRLRITAELVDTGKGYRLWSQRYDREMDDVFAIQEEIAQDIVDRLKIELLSDEDAPKVKRGTDDVAAYHLYLKGRHFWNQRALPKAIECFQQAIEREPDYALAHSGLSDAYASLGFYGFISSQDAYAKAMAAAERAAAIDEHLAEARHSLGLAKFYYGWDFPAAERDFLHAISLNPHYAPSYVWLSQLLSFSGRFDEAAAQGARALELEPISPHINATVGLGHLIAREYDTTIELCQAALDVAPDWGSAMGALGLAYAQVSRLDEAIQLMERGVELTRRAPLGVMWLGGFYARAGRPDDARALLAELEERSAQPVTLAWIYAYLGELDAAFEFLEAAVKVHDIPVLYLVAWPGFEELRADPRFARLMSRAGLESVSAVWTQAERRSAVREPDP